MLRLYKYLFSIIIVFFFTNVFALQTNWSSGIESQLRIISPSTHINNQNELYFGLQYKLKKGWKTYWLSPGEGGFPQKIDWSKSNNIKNIEVSWPVPQEFEILGFKSLGYLEEVIFPLKITFQNKDKEALVVLDVNYLVCKDICVPGKANLELLIPPGIGEITEYSFVIEKSLSSIPTDNLIISELDNVSANAYIDNNNVSIEIRASSQNVFVDPKFYLHTEFGLPVITPKISYSTNYKNLKANFVFEKKLFTKNSFNLDVIIKDNNKAFILNTNINKKEIQGEFGQNYSLIYFFIIAFFGGLILNIMPCVLPVLSIKLLSILQKPEERYLIRRSFFITSIGIISSFILLGLIFLILKMLGINIGWGMQFQQPLFLIIIALILFLFTLNLFGLFEFNVSSLISSKIYKKIDYTIYFKDFFNGFFATILATPCSAPLVGTAITVAFTQSYLVMIGIFFCMGLGMTSPYLFVAIFPGIVIALPKPGPWMQYVRYFLGLLLLGTFIWIVSILMNHNFYFSKMFQKIEDSNWVDITTVQLDDFIKKNDVVFVDITADWCATCQFNKINVINSKNIRKIFKENNVTKIRGDWTKPNKQIEEYLKKYNRFGIPFNVVYSKFYPEGIVLSELLTKKEIIDTVEKINKNQ